MPPAVNRKPEVSPSLITSCHVHSHAPTSRQPCEERSSQTSPTCSPISEMCMVPFWGSVHVPLRARVASQSCNLHSHRRWKSELAGHQETACGQSCKDESTDSNSVVYALFMEVPRCLLMFRAATELFPNWGKMSNNQNIRATKTDLASQRCLIPMWLYVPQIPEKYRHDSLKKPK